MIYLNNITDSQVVFVPKSGIEADGNLSLELKNTTGKDMVVRNVIDLNTSELFHNLAISLPETAATGEYEYALKKGDVVLSTGILVLQDPGETKQYNKSIEYEQYESK